MGDRANIFFVDTNESEGGTLRGIYLYTHWSGSVLPLILQSALRRGKGRWGDSQYLARIIFSEMIQEDVLTETGYGISTYIGDNEHSVIRVHDPDGIVSFHEPGREVEADDEGLARYSYADYVDADADELSERFSGGE